MINVKVAIVQKVVTDYRVEFYNELQGILANNNIQLSVFSGTVPDNEAFKDGLEEVSCGIRVKNHFFLNNRVYWQNLFQTLSDYDLVIVEQANSSLLNIPLILRRRIFKSNPKFSYWGHGATLHRKSGFFSKWIKQLLVNKSDYWFGYTEHTRSLLHKLGVSDDKIMIINNSLDTNEIIKARSDYDVRENQRKWGIKDGVTVVFCARLYENKAVPFIIDSCRIARKQVKKLNLVIIGDGPLRTTIEDMVKNDPWITMTGALYGKEKADALLMGNMMALPSHVGLSILDGFAAGLPVLVSDFNNHCPEIAYFDGGINGLMTVATAECYADAIVKLSMDQKLLQTMSSAAVATSDHYTIHNMVKNFAIGVEKALRLR